VKEIGIRRKEKRRPLTADHRPRKKLKRRIGDTGRKERQNDRTVEQEEQG
jgi:hypothetical protein